MEREKNTERQRGERRGGAWLAARSFQRTQARGGRLPFCGLQVTPPSQLPPSLSSPPSLPLMTQLPLSAEIKLQGP